MDEKEAEAHSGSDSEKHEDKEDDEVEEDVRTLLLLRCVNFPFIFL